MALVSIDQAKDHLRIDLDNVDDNADLSLKVDQASAIVLDYLGNRSIAIASISVANPTVITTSVPHSLTSGLSYTLTDTTTTPTINGARVVTVTGPKTFTVPVNVTTGQSTAAGTVASPAWAADTATGPMQAATLLILGHLYENRGDDMKADETLWAAVTRLLMRSRDPVLA